mmetsp:Transcript_30204/g.98730  ORF Transcript_30204/g.98730 Transcript_30204/m.98730 type:complete len:226 (-) Transcript_30204:864-1541(-)
MRELVRQLSALLALVRLLRGGPRYRLVHRPPRSAPTPRFRTSCRWNCLQTRPVLLAPSSVASAPCLCAPCAYGACPSSCPSFSTPSSRLCASSWSPPSIFAHPHHHRSPRPLGGASFGPLPAMQGSLHWSWISFPHQRRRLLHQAPGSAHRASTGPCTRHYTFIPSSSSSLATLCELTLVGDQIVAETSAPPWHAQFEGPLPEGATRPARGPHSRARPDHSNCQC